jgi:hypothetical protein
VRAFFDARVLDAATFEAASTKHLRTPWDKVSKDCAGYVRNLVR